MVKRHLSKKDENYRYVKQFVKKDLFNFKWNGNMPTCYLCGHFYGFHKKGRLSFLQYKGAFYICQLCEPFDKDPDRQCMQPVEQHESKGFGGKYTSFYEKEMKNLEKLNALLKTKGYHLGLEKTYRLVISEYDSDPTSARYQKLISVLDMQVLLDATKTATWDELKKESNQLSQDELKKKYVAGIYESENLLPVFNELLQRIGIQPVSRDEIKKEFEKQKTERFEKSLFDETYASVDNFLTMSGMEFEKFLENLFEEMGYLVTLTPASGDAGADLILEKHGKKTVVQAKRHSQKVSNSAVQEVHTAVSIYHADKGMVVTTNEFQNSAIEAANATGVELIDIHKLKEWIDEFL